MTGSSWLVTIGARARLTEWHLTTRKRAQGRTLDILPKRYVWSNTSREWALNSWHWIFMAQPDDMFERMISAIPAREFVLRHLGRTGKPAFFDDRALAEYVRCFTPKTIHGSCEDYRSAAGFDVTHDEADAKAGRKIAAPT